MKGKNFYSKSIRVPVLGGNVRVFICTNIDRAIREVEEIIGDKIISEDHRGYVASYVFCDYLTGRYMMFFKRSCSNGLIAHEVKHFLNILFRWNNYSISTTNDELECLLLEKVVDRVHNVFKYYKKKVRKKAIS